MFFININSFYLIYLILTYYNHMWVIVSHIPFTYEKTKFKYLAQGYC